MNRRIFAISPYRALMWDTIETISNEPRYWFTRKELAARMGVRMTTSFYRAFAVLDGAGLFAMYRGYTEDGGIANVYADRAAEARHEQRMTEELKNWVAENELPF